MVEAQLPTCAGRSVASQSLGVFSGFWSNVLTRASIAARVSAAASTVLFLSAPPGRLRPNAVGSRRPPNFRDGVIDRERSNAFTAWQRMGSPWQPTADQYRLLLSLRVCDSWAVRRSRTQVPVFELDGAQGIGVYLPTTRIENESGSIGPRPPRRAPAGALGSGGGGGGGSACAAHRERRTSPASFVLLAPGDAGCPGAGDPGTGRPQGSDHDAAVHAPQSGCARRGDSSAGVSRCPPESWRQFGDGGG
jgi:hypothetical protein